MSFCQYGIIIFNQSDLWCSDNRYFLHELANCHRMRMNEMNKYTSRFFKSSMLAVGQLG